MTDFMNDDRVLLERVEKAREERTKAGLDGLVGGLQAVIINTEQDCQKAAVQELLDFTGLEFKMVYEDKEFTTCLLKVEGSADFLVRSRKGVDNPFLALNTHPKSGHMPNARLETFVFRCEDLERYVSIQLGRGVEFMAPGLTRHDNYSIIQTMPSPYTGNSLAFIQWKSDEGNYATAACGILDWSFRKPDRPHLKNIKELDHTATRVRAEERDDAIIEFMLLTNYQFDFAVYVENLNSITNVARLGHGDYAQVFTSGIGPFITLVDSGPTEKFIHNYGTRVHHMAFTTENIDETFACLKEDGMGFLIDLVGSREEGLQQTFSKPSNNTLIVNEYIHRYNGFDGFFTKSNVTKLTRATEKQ